jgi:hypothetical protein
MRQGRFNSNGGRAWAKLYFAAIFERDQAIAALRVFEAEQALVARAHELFHAGGDNIEEQEDLDDAMYALHALRGTLQRGRDSQSVADVAA